MASGRPGFYPAYDLRRFGRHRNIRGLSRYPGADDVGIATMTNIIPLASVGAMIGDPTRAAMLVTLMDARALTAGELAQAAGVTPPTASGHLGQMLDAGLIALQRQGRHRYYRIASASVAEFLERMMAMGSELSAATMLRRPVRTGPRDQAIRNARLCYDHMAGELAVGIADRMIARGQLRFGEDGGVLTDSGLKFLRSLGVELTGTASAAAQSPAFCRPCLDWSVRRPHVGGVVGRAICAEFLQRGWIRRPRSGRVLAITRIGTSEFARHFDISAGGTAFRPLWVSRQQPE